MIKLQSLFWDMLEFLGPKHSPLCTHFVVATNFFLIIRINHQSQLNLCLKDSKWPGRKLRFSSIVVSLDESMLFISLFL